MKRDKIEETEIGSILEKMKKPNAFRGYPYPLNDMENREFEILLHHIFREKIESGEFSGKFDRVDLMQGVGERGRDCILTFQGKNRGVIQCKRYKNRLNEGEVVPEIIKFVLNYLEDNSLIDNLDNFTYYFAVSTGFTGKTIGYLRNFNNRIAQESKLQEWAEGVIEKYKSLNHIKYAEIENDLKEVLKTITIEKITPEEQIRSWIENSPAIIQCFFEVKLLILLPNSFSCS